ncbi:phosphoribosyltransferase family protein [Pedobacter gandavensis]|uniref:phosphoribosyltransferase n=1 Tax=Pedobacter TaxID=84567 RepID=UPI001C99C3F0|nr:MULTISPECIES: phosphoribosyltransferase family protein [Pedobacter]WGQ09858.1 phosphoribosyltransferase family protein [Pedobacter gandavensis]
MFKDRTEAGQLLAERLKKYRNDPGIVLAVPRGGVPLAYFVAKELGYPLELILAKKIGHPTNKEYAIGAANLSDYFIIHPGDVSEDYIQQELLVIRTRLKEMYKKFMGNKAPENIAGKTVIIIDDGMATGNTMLGTLKLIRKGQPGKIIIGVPVSSKEAVEKLSKEVNEVVVLLTPEAFYGVGAFYEDFNQISDEEVTFYLSQLQKPR